MTHSQRPLSLRGRTAVVTGAARGVGEAVARELAQRGARVALLGREEATLRRVASSLPTETLCRSVDVTDDDAMARVAVDVRERLGEVSIVVANAGIAEGGPFADSDPAIWRRVIEVNLVGSSITARSYLPDLLASRGYYLQIASLASIGAAPMMSSYCASKAGVESFAHALRAELAPHHVAVGIAYLNWTDTDMIAGVDQHPAARTTCSYAAARTEGPPRRLGGRPVGRCGGTPLECGVRPQLAPCGSIGTCRPARRGHPALTERTPQARCPHALRGNWTPGSRRAR
ncbi:hypothetical protein Stsp01_22430 [Streptomyces sp. NBRC 13847]|nr:hypothetical protein Stsp01_22430 [Streptomyces sp. NBRC 13847]